MLKYIVRNLYLHVDHLDLAAHASLITYQLHYCDIIHCTYLFFSIILTK